MEELALQLEDGTSITVPRSLDTITTYILLEQERWFEKETAIVGMLGAGMTVIDIGANFGVYSLPLARRVGPRGRVFAYEPASHPRAFLEKSRARNGFDNLEIVGCALSDRQGEARLSFGRSSELNSLKAGGGDGETVRLATLDEEDRARAWRDIDFVKIDAEGEELRILEGGRNFFANHSPLVMFEAKSDTEFDVSVPAAFRQLGYRIFRILNGAPLLVPVDEADRIDRSELNLFAAKPDRIATLARDGLLVEEAPCAWTPDENQRGGALDFARAQPYAAGFRDYFSNPEIDPAYRSALAGYAQWRSIDKPWPERYAALLFAFGKMLDLCQMGATLARLSSLARIAWDLGRNGACTDALNAIFRLIQSGQAAMREPFWPPHPRFDAIKPERDLADWFMVAVLEHQERCSSYSSLFTPFARNLDWLAAQPLASAEMERRRLLLQLKLGTRLAVPERLLIQAPDHINAEVWRSGRVPNTLAPRG